MATLWKTTLLTRIAPTCLNRPLTVAYSILNSLQEIALVGACIVAGGIGTTPFRKVPRQRAVNGAFCEKIMHRIKKSSIIKLAIGLLRDGVVHSHMLSLPHIASRYWHHKSGDGHSERAVLSGSDHGRRSYRVQNRCARLRRKSPLAVPRNLWTKWSARLRSKEQRPSGLIHERPIRRTESSLSSSLWSDCIAATYAHTRQILVMRKFLRWSMRTLLARGADCGRG